MRGALIALVVWGLFASRLWPLLTLVLVIGAAIAILPWIGPRALALARWRAVPLLGRLTGVAAAASIVAMGIGVTVLGATLSPLPVPSPTPVSATTAGAITPTPTPMMPASADPSPQSGLSRVRAQVLSVTDGDTIRVSIDGRSVAIRYIGIDTPETVDPRTSVECFGREATAFNRELVEGKTVELEKDVSELDTFGRTLRYVWIAHASGMVMANEELVRGGYATSSSYPPDVKYQERLRGLESAARAEGLGLWGAACAVASPTAAPAAVTPSPTAVPTPPPAPFVAPPTVLPTARPPTAAPRTVAPTTRANCDVSYPSVCIPPRPPDLNCPDIPFRRFVVLPPDPHGFDGDNDGIGCES